MPQGPIHIQIHMHNVKNLNFCISHPIDTVEFLESSAVKVSKNRNDHMKTSFLPKTNEITLSEFQPTI